jgi:PAS domain-containing protein
MNKKREWSDEEMVILRIIGETFTSILYRKQAEKEEERLKAQLSTAVEIAHLGPWELDIEKQIYTFNDHFYRIYHTTAEEMGGYKMSLDEYKRRFVHPDDIPLLDEARKTGANSDTLGSRLKQDAYATADMLL